MLGRILLGLLLLTLPVANVWAQAVALDTGDDPVAIETHFSATGVRPGGKIKLAVVFDIAEPFHINPHKPKDTFLIPTTVEIVDPPVELRLSTPIYPMPHEIDFGPEGAKEKVPVYSGRPVVVVAMAVAPDAEPGERMLTLNIRYQACDDEQCLLPKNVQRTARLHVVGPDGAVQSANEQLFAEAQTAGGTSLDIAFFGWDFQIDPTNLLILLPIAMIGGFLLNLTPCVLPLIPIKIMGISAAAGHRGRALVLGVIMSFGVVAFWLALGVLIATASGITATNQLFQYPLFTIGVGLIIAAMAVGMCGLFTVRLPQWVYTVNPSQDTAHGSFLFGVMTAVLSTPCTAPFMGAAAAWAATQNPLTTLSTFGAIGLGMALPYLVMSIFPSLVDRMPKTGPASELIKQVMGLLMLAAASYFVGTGLAGLLTTPPDPPTRAYWWVVAMFIVVAGGWLAVQTVRITSSPVNRLVFVGLGVVFIAFAVLLGARFTSRGPINWIYYTPERLADAQRQGKVVVLEFTAEWCLNCHALEQAVLHTSAVVERFNRDDVAAIKVDITGNNVVGNAKLLEVGRRTIPYLIVYSPTGEQVFASDAYTARQVIEAIDRAGNTAKAPT